MWDPLIAPRKSVSAFISAEELSINFYLKNWRAIFINLYLKNKRDIFVNMLKIGKSP